MIESLKDPLVILLAISGWLSWILKEVISLSLKRLASRSGKHEFIEVRSGLFFDVMMENGEYLNSEYYPRHSNFPLEKLKTKAFRLEFEGEIVNHSDVQIVYSKPVCEIWGVEGMRMVWNSPRIFLLSAETPAGANSEVVSIPVPAHNATRILVQLPLSMFHEEAIAEVNTTYAEAVVKLVLSLPEGKPREFRICTHSFAGENSIVWPESKKYPIYNIYSLNERGRDAGNHPQTRRDT